MVIELATLITQWVPYGYKQIVSWLFSSRQSTTLEALVQTLKIDLDPSCTMDMFLICSDTYDVHGLPSCSGSRKKSTYLSLSASVCVLEEGWCSKFVVWCCSSLEIHLFWTEGCNDIVFCIQGDWPTTQFRIRIAAPEWPVRMGFCKPWQQVFPAFGPLHSIDTYAGVPELH